MLRPHNMSRVIITGPNKLQEDVIKELHNLRILHIVEHSKNELADIGNPLQASNELSETLVKVRALITALKIKREENKFEFNKGLLDVHNTTNKLNEEVNKNSEELRKIEDLISKNRTIKQELEILKDINISLDTFAPYKSLTYFTGYINNKNKTNSLKEKLSKTTKKFMLIDSVSGKKTFIILFVDIKYKEQINSLLQKVNFSPVNFTIISTLSGTATNNLVKIKDENAKLESRKDGIKKQLEALAEKYRGFLISAEEALGQELEKAEAPLKFAATKDAFLIKGWVPIEDLSKAIDRLNSISKNKIYIHSESAKKTDKVPVKLDNPNYSKPFEFFIDMFSMPNYKEIDPTFFIFLTFPIFFGFMLGDFGYGITSFIIFWLLKKRFPKASALFNILLIASSASIIFGLVFGEFFGLEEIGYFHIPHLISRSHEMFSLMYIAIAIGIIHVNIGLIIGFVNILRANGLSHAIFEKGSWFVLQTGVALLALSYYNIINLPYWVGITFLTISLIMLYKGEGVKGIIELPSILTNILSYLRLMAIGLSSVSIAVVVNEMTTGFFHKGGFFILIGILILIIGHLLNILLGLFGSFLHSLRLHYVEFFSKFFQGGAEKYMPFGAKEE